MKLTVFTFILALLSLFFLTVTFQRLKSGALGFRSAAVFIILWLAIGLLSLFPSLLNSLTHLMQMEIRLFFVLITAVIILFALIFHLMSLVDSLRHDRDRLIQELSLLRHDYEQQQGLNQAGVEDDRPGSA